jgi:hypothetical protein
MKKGIVQGTMPFLYAQWMHPILILQIGLLGIYHPISKSEALET